MGLWATFNVRGGCELRVVYGLWLFTSDFINVRLIYQDKNVARLFQQSFCRSKMHLPLRREAEEEACVPDTGSQSKGENQDRDPEIADNIEEESKEVHAFPYRESNPGRLGENQNPER